MRCIQQVRDSGRGLLAHGRRPVIMSGLGRFEADQIQDHGLQCPCARPPRDRPMRRCHRRQVASSRPAGPWASTPLCDSSDVEFPARTSVTPPAPSRPHLPAAVWGEEPHPVDSRQAGAAYLHEGRRPVRSRQWKVYRSGTGRPLKRRRGGFKACSTVERAITQHASACSRSERPGDRWGTEVGGLSWRQRAWRPRTSWGADVASRRLGQVCVLRSEKDERARAPSIGPGDMLLGFRRGTVQLGPCTSILVLRRRPQDHEVVDREDVNTPARRAQRPPPLRREACARPHRAAGDSAAMPPGPRVHVLLQDLARARPQAMRRAPDRRPSAARRWVSRNSLQADAARQPLAGLQPGSGRPRARNRA